MPEKTVSVPLTLQELDLLVELLDDFQDQMVDGMYTLELPKPSQEVDPLDEVAKRLEDKLWQSREGFNAGDD
jgi:hypothetical protein